MRTHYTVLGVAETATTAEIDRAFSRLMERADFSGSDVSGEAARGLRSIRQAHAILSDPARRQQYDEILGQMRPAEQKEYREYEPEKYRESEPYNTLPQEPGYENPHDAGPEYVWHSSSTLPPYSTHTVDQSPQQPEWTTSTSPALSSVQRSRARSLAYGAGWRLFARIFALLYLAAIASQVGIGATLGVKPWQHPASPYLTLLIPLAIAIYAAHRRVSTVLGDLRALGGTEIDRIYEDRASNPPGRVGKDAGVWILVIVILIACYVVMEKDLYREYMYFRPRTLNENHGSQGHMAPTALALSGSKRPESYYFKCVCARPHQG